MPDVDPYCLALTRANEKLSELIEKMREEHAKNEVVIAEADRALCQARAVRRLLETTGMSG